MNTLYTQDTRACKEITRTHGTSYFISTYFFPRKMREQTWVLYAFVRYPDEIVDTIHADTEKAHQALLAWESEWERAYAGDTNVHPILRANAVLWKECAIPLEYSHSFFDAMKSDTQKNRFATYEELQSYMYGSATVVGYMMCHIIGYAPGALRYAKALGEAFQLTNFLRDIKEDYARGRIYLPQEDMQKYNVEEKDIEFPDMSTATKELIMFELERNEALYKEALTGIPLLEKSGQRAVRIALYLYRAIAQKIAKDPARIYKTRTRIGLGEKITIIASHF